MKKFLIHLLGGYTKTEFDESSLALALTSKRIGYQSALTNLRTFAEQLHGQPADEWCKLMYNHICGSIARLTEEIKEDDIKG